MRLPLIGLVALGIFAISITIEAQGPNVQPRVLSRTDTSVPGYELVQTMATYESGQTTRRHRHPVGMVGFVVEGVVVVERDGAAPISYSQGETFIVPAGVAHSSNNGGTTAARLLSSYVLRKDQPLNVPNE